MRGRPKTKSVAVESPKAFNSKSSENTIERHVFEKLCLDTSLRGFSYDPTLLVDLEKVSSFDEACIRLTTKCGSIVTQLCSLGHNITDFAVAAVPTATGTLTSPKTPKVPKIPESPVSLFSSQVSPSSLYFLNSQTSTMLSPTSLSKPKFHGFDFMNKDTLTLQEKRNVRVMSELWDGLKKKSYTGMVAVARVMDTSLPNNSSKDRYSVKALTDTLLGNIKGYFMFQNVSSTFDKDFHNTGALNNGKNNNNEPGREYLLYVVYRSKAVDKNTKKAASKHKATEADKLNNPWSADVSGNSRKLRHESGDSTVSSCSSISSNTSGGPCSFSVPSGKPSNLRLEIRQDTIIASAMNKKGKFASPFSTPPLRSTPVSQKRKLITPPSPTTSKTSPLQSPQGQKLFTSKSPTHISPTKSPTVSQRNLRHHPYKQTNSSPNLEQVDTVSKAINTAIASVSPKTQPQSLFTNQVKQQQNIPVKKQNLTQLDKRQQQQNKQTVQVQTHQPTRFQQQKKSPETTAKPVLKNVTTPKRVPITAPKTEDLKKNLRSYSSSISSLPRNLRSSPAVPAPAPVSQRNLRHSFSKK